MKVKLITVRDSKTELFGQVAQAKTLAEAERLFSDLVSDKDSLIGKHPEDYDLWCLGEFDMHTGALSFEGCPFIVAQGINFKS